MKRDKARTPKRRTPGRRKLTGRLTPSSKTKFNSASKLSMILPKPVTATRETSKRALFQSPPQEKPKVNFTPEVAVRVEKSKRALFSPPHRQSHNDSPSFINRTISDVSIGMKRRRDNDDENFLPRASKIAKSQSMAGGTVLNMQSSGSLFKSISESSMNGCQQLSDSHKKVRLETIRNYKSTHVIQKKKNTYFSIDTFSLGRYRNFCGPCQLHCKTNQSNRIMNILRTMPQHWQK